MENQMEKEIENRINDQLSGKEKGNHIFNWTKPIVDYLIEKRKSKISKIRDHLRKNEEFHLKKFKNIPSYLHQFISERYGHLPDEIMDERIKSTLNYIINKGSLAKIVTLRYRNDITPEKLKIIKSGEYYEVVDLKYSRAESLKNFLEQFKK
tara:strand:+ start:1449 stop:1904 length:456 start_codon:yes stop_codon:yes gene_type:complete